MNESFAALVFYGEDVLSVYWFHCIIVYVDGTWLTVDLTKINHLVDVDED